MERYVNDEEEIDTSTVKKSRYFFFKFKLAYNCCATYKHVVLVCMCMYISTKNILYIDCWPQNIEKFKDLKIK